MNQVTRFQTRDGVLHESMERAEHHINKQIGVEVSALSQLIIHTDGKFSKAIAMLENPETEKHFCRLIELREDLKLAREDNED